MKKGCNKHGLSFFKEIGQGKNKRYRCAQCKVDNRRKRRVVLKQQAVDYKGGSCYSCGYWNCLQALDFHHLDPEEKEFSISEATKTTLESIKEELDKCILLCKNCHSEVHAGLLEIFVEGT
jgi:hypothetical protein